MIILIAYCSHIAHITNSNTVTTEVFVTHVDFVNVSSTNLIKIE